jgi:hypothetical protein
MRTMKEEMHYFSMRQTSEYPAWYVTLWSQMKLENMIACFVLDNMSGNLFWLSLGVLSGKVEELENPTFFKGLTCRKSLLFLIP